MEADDPLRKRISQLLERGFPTEFEPRAYTSEEVNHIIFRLQSQGHEQLEEKINIAGFTLQPYQPPGVDEDLVQSCETCMYYVVHRQFCELPELALPVEKKWSCRLWRI